MTTRFYLKAAEEAVSGTGLNWTAGDYRCLLLNASTTTPDSALHEFVSDIVADECSDGSYARVALTGKVNPRDETDVRVEMSSNTIDFGALTGETPIFAVIYRHVGADSSNVLMAIHDLTPVAADGSGYSLTLGAEGGWHVRSAA